MESKEHKIRKNTYRMSWWYGGSETEVEYVIEKVIFFHLEVQICPSKTKNRVARL